MMVGEKWAVHMPKPKGAGTAPMKISSSLNWPEIAARLWK